MPPSVIIESSHNPRFRAALALREARDRRATGHILVDGGREIGRALASGVRPVELWVAPERVRDPEARAALRDAAAGGVPAIHASAALLAQLAVGARAAGLVLVAPTPSPALAALDALIVADPRSDPWNPNAIRASMGTVFRVPLAVCTAAAAMDRLRAERVRIIAARVDGSVPYASADLTGALAIVLGSEADGLSPAWTGPDVSAVHIPMRGVADSLNVSVSAAILFYEARRQRDLGGVGRDG